MIVQTLLEPKLQFGSGSHVDNKFGLLHYGPFDMNEARRPEKILMGVVGSPASIDGVVRWFEEIQRGVPSKGGKKPNLFPAYPSQDQGSPFRTRLIFEKGLQDSVLTKDYVSLSTVADETQRLFKLADVFVQRARQLRDKNADVVVIALPVEVFPLFGEEWEVEDDDEEEEVEQETASNAVEPSGTEANAAPTSTEKPRPARKPHFHDILKAAAMLQRIPIQIVRPSTYDPKAKKKETDRYGKTRRLQDPATKAWNVMAAVYYKAGGIPWRIPRRDDDLRTCFLGISYYETPDQKSLQTSIAQVFDERGYGLIVRGGDAKRSKEDRQVHLDRTQMKDLIATALKSYSDEHHHAPARLILHKTSQFNRDEIGGVEEATDAANIRFVDMVSLSESFIRLFRDGYYPPLRGTALELDTDQTLLYTRGTSSFYEEYPGMYVPRTLKVRFDQIVSPKQDLLEGLLMLSKMNWNNTQMDELHPITTRAARQVGAVLKHVPLNTPIQGHYMYYM